MRHAAKKDWVGEKGVPSEFLFGKTLEDHKNDLAADFVCAFCNRIAADPVATSCEHYFWFEEFLNIAAPSLKVDMIVLIFLDYLILHVSIRSVSLLCVTGIVLFPNLLFSCCLLLLLLGFFCWRVRVCFIICICVLMG